MRIEAHEKTGDILRTSPLDQPLNHIEMPAMHAIEGSDRDDSLTYCRRKSRLR
jgi:hypothetical protein